MRPRPELHGRGRSVVAWKWRETANGKDVLGVLGRGRRCRPPFGQNKYRPCLLARSHPRMNILERFLAQNILRPPTSSFRGSPTSLGRGARAVQKCGNPFPGRRLPPPAYYCHLQRERREEGEGSQLISPVGPTTEIQNARPADALSPSPVGRRLK